MDWLAVIVLSAIFGSVELLGRYRDNPLAALGARAGLLYIAANIAASLLALALLYAFRPAFAFSATGANFDASWWGRVLTAGLGAMAFFRTSLFNVRIGNSDVGIGPSYLFQVILLVADRGVDRARAMDRANTVARIMSGVVYDKAKTALPAYCLALMQNMADTDQQQLGRQLLLLEQAVMPVEVKVLNLGLALINAVGAEVLEAAVTSLGSKIK